MPFKDPQRRWEYARKYYSSPGQKYKKRSYDRSYYSAHKDRIDAKNRRALYPHRFVYTGEWVCSRCGSTSDLVIHHADHDHDNNDPSNLVCLCRSCHASYHATVEARGVSGRFERKEQHHV